MAPVFRPYHHPLIWLTLSVLALGLSAGAAWRTVTALHVAVIPASADTSAQPMPNPSAAARLTLPEDVAVFQVAPGERELDPADRLADRFRLAGTFFMLSADLQPSTRKAVLVDGVSGADHIVQEGDILDNLTVVNVAHDHVIMEAGETRAILALGAGPGTGMFDDADPLDLARQDTDDDASAQNENPFGDQIDDHRWVFQRDRLIDYYKEVMQSPQRLKQVFDSMEPLYDQDRRITGYSLNIKGEADFFEAVGLREGDVVRHVNSMAMSSRLRAEFLIREFVHDRLNVFVLDVEREGTPEQLIYEIR